MLKIKHLASAELFATTKFSADSSNTTYFIGNNTTQIAGTPDVLYEDLVFCKGCDLIYTHGHFYGNQPDGNFVKQIANLATYNGVENEIVQYVGEDTNDYKRGFFYKMTPTPTITTTLVDVMGLEEGKGYFSEGFDPYDPTAQGFWVKEKHPNFSYLTGLFTTGTKAPTGNDYASTLNPNTTYRVFAKFNTSTGSGGYFAYDVNDTNVYQTTTNLMQIDAYANNKITVRDGKGYQYELELTDIETITADYCVSDATQSMGDYYSFNINFPKNSNTKLVINSNTTNDNKHELMEIEYETVQEEREVTIMQLAWQQIDIQPKNIISDDLTVSGDTTIGGDATISGSLTVGDSTITDIDDSIKPDSNNPVKNSAIYNIIQNPIHYYYNANTAHGEISNRAKAIQDVLNDIMPKTNSNGNIKFAVIRHQEGFAFFALIAQYGNSSFIVEFGFSTDDLITYKSFLSNGTWGTVSMLKSF